MTVVLENADYLVVANGATTAFPTAIYATDATAIKVYSRNVATGVDTLLSASTYTVSGLASASGCTVTFATAPAADTTLVFFRSVDFVQTLDLQNQRGYDETDMMRALDDLEQQMQVLRSRSLRSVRAALGERLSALPPAPQRIGKFLGFDSTGDITVSSVLSTAEGGTSQTVSEMIALANVSAGDYHQTLGYWAVGDRGASTYEIMTLAAFGSTPNEISDFLLDNGLVAKLLLEPTAIRAEQFGVRHGYECSARWQEGLWQAVELAEEEDDFVVTYSCHTGLLAKDTLWITNRAKTGGAWIILDQRGTIKATTGGELEDSLYADSVPMIYLGVSKSIINFRMLDCNRLCSGILVNKASATRVWYPNIVRFQRFGYFVTDNLEGIAAEGSNGNHFLMYPNIKQWEQTDEEFDDPADTQWTADCLVSGHKDWQLIGGTIGWGRCAVLKLGKTTGSGDVEGRTIYNGYKSQGCGDFFMIGTHLMQARPNGPPRQDNIANGGPINLESWNQTNKSYNISIDWDSGTGQLYGHREVFIGVSAITGGQNELDSKVILFDPLIRLYARSGSTNPAGFELEQNNNLTIGFFSFEGVDWTGDYETINYDNRRKSPGNTGPVEYVGTWNAETATEFPTTTTKEAFWLVRTNVSGSTETFAGQEFTDGDLLYPLVDTPSTSVYAGNWYRSQNNAVEMLQRGVQGRANAGERYVHLSASGIPYVSYYSPGASLSAKYYVGATVAQYDWDGTTWQFDAENVQLNEWISTAGGVLKPAASETQDIGANASRVANAYVKNVNLKGSVASGVNFSAGTGSPEGVLAAGKGSIYLRDNGTSGTLAYLKSTASGNTGWEALAPKDFFSTRAAFVTWIATNTPEVGTVVVAEGYAYRYIGSGTAISDLPGWVPAGQPYLTHWPYTVAGLQAATLFCESGTLIVPKGTWSYTITADNTLNARDNIRIIGEGQGITFMTFTHGLSYMTLANGTNIKFQQMTVTLNSTFVGVSNCALVRQASSVCEFSDFTFVGNASVADTRYVNLVQVSDSAITADDLVIKNCSISGVTTVVQRSNGSLATCKRVRIEDNEVSSVTSATLSINAPAGSHDEIWITGNTIYNHLSGSLGIDGNAIAVAGSKRVIITGNIINVNAPQGIHIEDDADDVVIDGNAVTMDFTDITEGFGGINVLRGFAGAGGMPKRIVISNNVVRQSSGSQQGFGIWVNDFDSINALESGQSVIVQGNVVEDFACGYDVHGGAITGLDVSDNIAGDCYVGFYGRYDNQDSHYGNTSRNCVYGVGTYGMSRFREHRFINCTNIIGALNAVTSVVALENFSVVKADRDFAGASSYNYALVEGFDADARSDMKIKVMVSGVDPGNTSYIHKTMLANWDGATLTSTAGISRALNVTATLSVAAEVLTAAVGLTTAEDDIRFAATFEGTALLTAALIP